MGASLAHKLDLDIQMSTSWPLRIADWRCSVRCVFVQWEPLLCENHPQHKTVETIMSSKLFVSKKRYLQKDSYHKRRKIVFKAAYIWSLFVVSEFLEALYIHATREKNIHLLQELCRHFKNRLPFHIAPLKAFFWGSESNHAKKCGKVARKTPRSSFLKIWPVIYFVPANHCFPDCGREFCKGRS